MRTLPAGQYIPGHSFLHQLDARAKILCLFLLMAAVIGASSPWGYLLALAVIFLLVLASRLPVGPAVAPVRGIYWFLLVVFLMNALFFGGKGAGLLGSSGLARGD